MKSDLSKLRNQRDLKGEDEKHEFIARMAAKEQTIVVQKQVFQKENDHTLLLIGPLNKIYYIFLQNDPNYFIMA